MDGITYFFWLAGQALTAGPVLLPDLTLLAVAGLITAAVSSAKNKGLVLRPRSLWLLAPFAIPVIILIYGVIFVYQGPVWSAPAWRGAVIQGLIWSHVPVAALLLWRMRDVWVVVLGLSVFQWCLSLCTGFMAGMSVTNVWL